LVVRKLIGRTYTTGDFTRDLMSFKYFVSELDPFDPELTSNPFSLVTQARIDFRKAFFCFFSAVPCSGGYLGALLFEE